MGMVSPGANLLIKLWWWSSQAFFCCFFILHPLNSFQPWVQAFFCLFILHPLTLPTLSSSNFDALCSMDSDHPDNSLSQTNVDMYILVWYRLILRWKNIFFNLFWIKSRFDMTLTSNIFFFFFYLALCLSGGVHNTQLVVVYSQMFPLTHWPASCL